MHDQTITFDDGAEMYAVPTAEKSVGDTFNYRSGGCVMAFMFECHNSAEQDSGQSQVINLQIKTEKK